MFKFSLETGLNHLVFDSTLWKALLLAAELQYIYITRNQ